MYKDLITLVRIAAGIILFLLGIIGLFLPILQGALLIVVAVMLLSPTHGKVLLAKVRQLKEQFRMRRKRRSGKEFDVW